MAISPGNFPARLDVQSTHATLGASVYGSGSGPTVLALRMFVECGAGGFTLVDSCCNCELLDLRPQLLVFESG